MTMGKLFFVVFLATFALRNQNIFIRIVTFVLEGLNACLLFLAIFYTVLAVKNKNISTYIITFVPQSDNLIFIIFHYILYSLRSKK